MSDFFFLNLTFFVFKRTSTIHSFEVKETKIFEKISIFLALLYIMTFFGVSVWENSSGKFSVRHHRKYWWWIQTYARCKVRIMTKLYDLTKYLEHNVNQLWTNITHFCCHTSHSPLLKDIGIWITNWRQWQQDSLWGWTLGLFRRF